jgi:predicted 3-demethylubiquinone-9 3-methyltransferase (glyoxalase superfamily)
MQGITTFLWFDTEAEEAATFYTSVFPDDSRITTIDHYGSAGPREAGLVKTVSFEVAGQRLMALNGGPGMAFTEAVSLMVHCEGQDEVDRVWDRLTEGGEPGPCGWLKDRYGLSWQVVPALLFELVADPDQVRAQAVMAAMLQMGKLDCAALQAAFDNAGEADNNDPTVALAGTSWVVQEIDGVATVAPRPELAFGEDGRLSGTTGVNRVMGRWELAEGRLTVADPATTRMAGPPDAMELETRLLALLGSPLALTQTGDRLELAGQGTVAMLINANT